ncbi:MAG TPA: hypothetical protein PLP17_02555 [Oligoflexia bacterium]|nr:hypothetical protein [Oligoflexia bacterium]
MFRVLFVCDTDTSLAPLAAAMFNRLILTADLARRLQAESAGAFPGQTPRPVDHRVLALAKEHELDLAACRSRDVESLALNSFNLILGMNVDIFWRLKQLCVDLHPAPQIQVFTEYSGQLGLREAADPLLGEIGFNEAYEVLERTLEKMLRELKKRIGAE